MWVKSDSSDDYCVCPTSVLKSQSVNSFGLKRHMCAVTLCGSRLINKRRPSPTSGNPASNLISRNGDQSWRPINPKPIRFWGQISGILKCIKFNALAIGQMPEFPSIFSWSIFISYYVHRSLPKRTEIRIFCPYKETCFKHWLAQIFWREIEGLLRIWKP